MATVATFTLPAESFPLGRIFDGYPGVTVELEQIIPTNEGIIPYFWVRDGEDIEEIEVKFLGHPDVHSIQLVDEVNGAFLLRTEWVPDYGGILHAIAETDVVLISGTGTATEWTFEVRSEEREPIAVFQGYCQEHDIPVTLTSLHALSEMETGTEYDLTEAQREALVIAYEQGYYRSPREITLEEMAEDLGITGQSLGSRLRRGIHRLIGSTLVGPK